MVMGPLKQGITTVADFTPWPIEKSKVQNKHDSAATKISEDTNFGIVEKISLDHLFRGHRVERNSQIAGGFDSLQGLPGNRWWPQPG